MNNKEKILEIARRIAEEAHSGQYRNDGKTPYIVHIKDVVNRVGNDLELQVLAWLHDTLEDSSFTADKIVEKGIPKSIVKELNLLTHHKATNYKEYIFNISKSRLATRVKIADIISNITDEPSLKQVRKYSEALEILTNSIIDIENVDTTNSSVKELVSDITKGLFENTEDPISWLSSYVDEINSINLSSVIASKNLVSENILELKTPPTCIIVDCGTGETKILLYKILDSKIIFEELIKIDAATSYFGKSTTFINTIKSYFDEQKADIVLISASAWLREAPKNTLELGNELLSQVLDSGMLCKVLEAKEEGWLELIAGEFIGKKLNLLNNCVYSSGAGSTQITTDFNKILTIRIGNEIGRKLITENKSLGYNQWLKIIKNDISVAPVKLDGKILCISASTYAALAVKLPLNEYIPVHNVISRFSAFVELFMKKENLTKLELRNLSNVIQHLETFKLICSDTSELIFIRDTVVNNTNYRITWSFGWYLELINRLGWKDVKLKSLAGYRIDQMNLSQIGQDILNLTSDSSVSSTAAGEVLLDIDQTADILLEKAVEVEKYFTPFLVQLAREYNSELKGLKFKFKTKGSLIRKLKSRLKKLINYNTNIQLYIPRLIDVFHEVDDTLRYTVVIKEDEYSKYTLEILEKIKSAFSTEYECFSFWSKESTYYGVNTFITIDNFTLEIQFHTPESLKMKQTDAHDIYESYRNLPNSYAKFILYENMKNVWKTVNIPKNIRNISEPQRLSDSIMEQYGLIRKLTNLNIPKFINNQICFRLVRGKNEKEFEYLSYPISKKLVWVSSSSKINRLFSDKKDKLHAISDYTGKSLDWIHKKYEEGYKWRLIIIPKQHCILADWNGLFKLITKFYPSIAARVLRSKENLMKHKFNEIEQQIVPTNTFRFLKDNPLHENHIDLNKYQDIVIPELWQTRALLYNLIGLNENYAGDGFVYNDSNEKMHKEYFTINGEILEIFGVKVIPIET